MTDKVERRVKTPEASVAYASLAKPKAFADGATPKYSITVLIAKKKDDGTEHKENAEWVKSFKAQAKAVFDEADTKKRSVKTMKLPIADGDAEDAPDWQEGHWVIRFSSGQRKLAYAPSRKGGVAIIKEAGDYPSRGDVVKVNGSLGQYDLSKDNYGITLYLGGTVLIERRDEDDVYSQEAFKDDADYDRYAASLGIDDEADADGESGDNDDGADPTM